MFVVKDLVRDKFYTMGVYVYFDTSINVNRKLAPG